MITQAPRQQCTALRRDGSPCTGRALPSSSEQRCFAHDASRQEELRRSRAAGGRARSTAARAGRHLPPHLADVQSVLLDLVQEVRDGKTPPRAAEVVATLAARLLDYSRYADERDERKELEERIELLEERLKLAARR